MTATTEQIAPAQPATEGGLEVVIAERHVRAGERANAWKCPLALSLDEAGHWGVFVACVYLIADGHRYDYPESLVEWVHDFDHGLPVHPERWLLHPVA